MSELISRQAAIGAVLGVIPYDEYWKEQIEKAVNKLPSARSEIVRCKDCKYGDTFHKFDEPDMPMKCLGQHYGGTYPDDFCSYAERREE